MTCIYLTEDDVTWLMDVPSAIDPIETLFREWGRGNAVNEPRRRASTEHSQLHVMFGAVEYLNCVGYKAYTTNKRGAQFHVVLMDATTGERLAWIEANRLGQMRTGAASAVAASIMANPDAAVMGCLGTGFQARAQVQAHCAVRPIRRVEVYGRNELRRKQFADEVSQLCNVEVVPVHSPDEAAAEKDIVITATTSRAPVFDGRVLEEGTHISAIGSNYLTRTELDVATIRLADHIVCDSISACQLEAGDFVQSLEEGTLEWARVANLADVLSGRETGRAHHENITLFKSVGLAIEDLALGMLVLERARIEKIGTPLPC